MDQYKLEYEKGSGTFSVVFTALSLKTGNHVAIKCMKKKFQSVEKVKKLKQIQALNILSSHQNIIKMIEALYDEPSGKLALVFELMDMNLYECLKSKKSNLTYHKIKLYMFQVLRAIEYCIAKAFFIATSNQKIYWSKGIQQNWLISALVKVSSFLKLGKHNQQPYTDYISTRWYRAPECLMTDGYYNQKMDIWGFGCVLFQLLTKKPLFPGKDELDQVHRINNILGTPKQQLLERFRSQASHMDINFSARKGIGIEKFLPSGCPNDLKDLLHKLLAYDPDERISAQSALKHEYFSEFTNSNPSQTGMNNQDLRSTFFTMKWSQVHKQKSQQGENQQTIKKKNLSKGPKCNSKNNLEKNQDPNILPKINGTSNYSNFMDSNPKKTTYSKKHSNDFNFTIVPQKKH